MTKNKATRTSKKWLEKEDAIIISNQNLPKNKRLSIKELIEVHFPNRTKDAIAARKRTLGFAKDITIINLLSEDDVELIKENYFKLTNKEIHEKYFPDLPYWVISATKRKYFPELHERSSMFPKGLSLNQLKENHSTVFQILLSSILGDGGINYKTRNRAHFIEGHGKSQRDYIIWKSEILKPVFGGSLFNGKDNMLTYQTNTTECIDNLFKPIRDEMYTVKNKYSVKTRIPEYFMKNINTLGLLIHYLDDGSNGLGRRGHHLYLTIAASRYNKNDLALYVQSLNDRLNLNLRISKNQGIIINSDDRDKLLPIWKGYFKKYNIPDCMRYKVFMEDAVEKLEKSKTFNVRWTSGEDQMIIVNSKRESENIQPLLPNRTLNAIIFRKIKLTKEIEKYNRIN